jgi:hypothetical protein
MIGVNNESFSTPGVDRTRILEGVLGVWGMEMGLGGGDDDLDDETRGKAIMGPSLLAAMGP